MAKGPTIATITVPASKSNKTNLELHIDDGTVVNEPDEIFRPESQTTGDSMLENEDILCDSLEILYGYRPISFDNHGAQLILEIDKRPLHHSHTVLCPKSTSISLQTPDTDAAHWALHASSIWISSIYLAKHLHALCLEDLIDVPSKSSIFQILELGASAGLPSIAIAKLYADRLPDGKSLRITATDYPDDSLIKALSGNVDLNGVSRVCRVIPYAWGTDPSPLLRGGAGEGFDLVIAADTLWNPDLHAIFVDSLKATLKRSTTSMVHLVVGLHTGRYTIQSFLDRVVREGFDVDRLSEMDSGGNTEGDTEVEREWKVSREGEDDKERRKWVVWIQLKWNTSSLGLQLKK